MEDERGKSEGKREKYREVWMEKEIRISYSNTNFLIYIVHACTCTCSVRREPVLISDLVIVLIVDCRFSRVGVARAPGTNS